MASATIHPAIGKYCIVRTSGEGVHAGTVTAVTADTISLKDSRRLWYWQATKSLSLSGVAVHGIDPKKSKIAPKVPPLHIERTNVLSFLEASDVARASIEGAPDAEQR